MNKKNICFDKKFLVFSFVVSILFVFIASYSTSPLYPNYYGHDSAQFQLLGKCWLQGIIPPLDIFDHKGPLIFFINAVGYFLTSNSLGVLFIQFIFLTCTVYIFCVTASYYLSSHSIIVYFVTLISLLFLCSSYNDGNLTEEYCLPFISLSIYLQLKYLNSKTTKHPPICSLIYGLSFGVCLCTRVTNAIMICSGILVVYVLLFYGKYFKNLIQNIFCLILGVSFICFPFLIYYYMHNGLYEAFYCAILANIEYKKYIVSWLVTARPFNFFVYSDVFFPTYCLFFSSVFLFLRKKYAFACYSVLTSILESYLFLSGSLFRHYAMISIPQILLFTCEIIFVINNYIKLNFTLRMLKNFCILATSVFAMYNIVDFANKSCEIYSNYDNNIYEYDDILSLANKQEPFIAYGGDSLVHFYIRNNIIPCYRFYILQEWQSKVMPKIANNIHFLYSSCKAKWILSDNNYENIQDILNMHYTVVGYTTNYKLWKLK